MDGVHGESTGLHYLPYASVSEFRKKNLVASALTVTGGWTFDGVGSGGVWHGAWLIGYRKNTRVGRHSLLHVKKKKTQKH
jgi:hypothetical protein